MNRAFPEKLGNMLDEVMPKAGPAEPIKINGVGHASDTRSWPRPSPIVSTLPPVETFAPQMLPASIRDYVLDVADRQQAPVDFAAVAAVCGLAAVLGNKVRIRPKQHDDWQVVANQWGALIGRPSAMKTPAMQAALAPVYALQDEMRESWKASCTEAAVDGTLAGLDAKAARKRAQKLLNNGDRDGAKRALADANPDEQQEPPCPRLVVNDATVEKLGELLNENQNGLLLIRDELPGFLAKMESEECQGERAFYLEAFNGDGRFTYDRIGRGTVVIENCTLSLVGGVQPSRLAPIVRGAVGGSANDGLIQRLQLAVWPDDRGSWEWVDRSPDLLAKATYEQAFRDLHNLDLTDNGHAVLRFTTEAQHLFREWMEEIQGAARVGNLPSSLESHLLKLPKTVAGLALLFELVEGGRVAVGEGATMRALGWADYLQSHATRLYSAGETMAEDGARLILERRAQLPEPFTAREIQHRNWAGLGDRNAVGAALDVLEATNHCRALAGPIGTTGGRPSVSYSWHPALKMEH